MPGDVPSAPVRFSGFHRCAMAEVPNNGTVEIVLDGKGEHPVDALTLTLPRNSQGGCRGVRLVTAAQVSCSKSFTLPLPFVYQDDDRTFLVSAVFDKTGGRVRFGFENLYHPATADFLRQLQRDGVEGLLRRDAQERCCETVLFRLPDAERELAFVPNSLSEIKHNFEGSNALVLADRDWPADIGNVDSKQQGDGWIVTTAKFSCTVRREDGELLVFQDADQQYQPSGKDGKPVANVLPLASIDFATTGAYSIYNWELFFHAPLLLAERLSKNQRIAQAQQWFHYVFDPTDVSAGSTRERYWKFRPFTEEARNPAIVDLMALALYEGEDGPTARWRDRRRELATQVALWRATPFDPHTIARLRPSAYQKTVVMKYIDMLVAWGDELFRRDTIESINEATQLYVLAAELLGERPATPPVTDARPSERFADLTGRDGSLRDAFVRMEDQWNAPPAKARPDPHPGEWTNSPALSYFDVPANDKLLGYWDLVADRLFKIRNSQNIEGIERQLALFEPPIDPGLLVRAAAAGLDLGEVLRDANLQPLPYRFRFVLAKALEFCRDVEALGRSLLAALEAKDADALDRLHLRQMSYDLQRQIADKAIEEARQQVADLEEALAHAGTRLTAARSRAAHILSSGGVIMSEVTSGFAVAAGAGESLKPGGEAVSGLKSWNKPSAAFVKQKQEAFESTKGFIEEAGSEEIRKGDSAALLTLAQGMYQLGGSAGSFPTVIAGGAGVSSPVALTETGGAQIKGRMETLGKVLETAAKIKDAAMAIAKAVQEIQEKKDKAEADVKEAEANLARTTKQLAAAGLRVEIAELRKKRIVKAAADVEELDEFMRSRFTNAELHGWRVSQLSTLYSQSYQMARGVAKRAELGLRDELGITDTAYVGNGGWDSLRKGLLAGERLHLELRRMEQAYLQANTRRNEITRRVSLKEEAAEVLTMLKANLVETGCAAFELTERLFDRDYPGHYLRRLKTVALTLDFGPDAPRNVPCTLTLLSNTVRKSPVVTQGYARGTADDRFDLNVTPVSIAVSSGREDSGLFAVDLDDDRYLPFEGAGAAGIWQLAISTHGPIKPASIADVILHLRYTAVDGGTSLGEWCCKDLKENDRASILAA